MIYEQNSEAFTALISFHGLRVTKLVKKVAVGFWQFVDSTESKVLNLNFEVISCDSATQTFNRFRAFLRSERTMVYVYMMKGGSYGK